MKKIKIFITIIILSLLLGTTISLAISSSISINGEENIYIGEEGSLKIKINSDELIGVVSGKLDISGNITAQSPTGINGWNLTYNSETGAFNIYKAEGTKEEEIIEIKYTAGNTNGTAKVKLSELKITTTGYNTIDYKDIEKNITIKSKQTEEQNKPELNIDNTGADDNIPQTGVENYELIAIFIILILALIFYIKYNKYKKIV